MSTTRMVWGVAAVAAGLWLVSSEAQARWLERLGLRKKPAAAASRAQSPDPYAYSAPAYAPAPQTWQPQQGYYSADGAYYETSGWSGWEYCDDGYCQPGMGDPCWVRHQQRCRRMCGQTWYPTCPPYCSPCWGYHPTCWRRMSECYVCPRPEMLMPAVAPATTPPPAAPPASAPYAEPVPSQAFPPEPAPLPVPPADASLRRPAVPAITQGTRPAPRPAAPAEPRWTDYLDAGDEVLEEEAESELPAVTLDDELEPSDAETELVSDEVIVEEALEDEAVPAIEE